MGVFLWGRMDAVEAPMRRIAFSMLLAVGGALSLPMLADAQTKTVALDTTAGLKLVNVVAAPAALAGKKGLRIAPTAGAKPDDELLAVLEGVELGSGTLEAEIAGEPGPGAAEGARGFVGLAFRLQADLKTYDAFYLRPTNGRADDQMRRNHSAQYISHPDWPWFRLRKETPEKYESYVDLVPGAWTKVKVEVRGDKARLFVHGNEQPTLIVNDVKSGASAKGGIALWLGPGTVALFRSLTITP
jgi:hypothetical protein